MVIFLKPLCGDPTAIPTPRMQVACDRLRREFGVDVQTGRAYVAYREGISEETEM